MKSKRLAGMLGGIVVIGLLAACDGAVTDTDAEAEAVIAELQSTLGAVEMEQATAEAAALPEWPVPLVIETGQVFTTIGETPIIPRGPADAWDFRYTEPGVTMFRDGKFHMLRNSFPDWPDASGMNYLTSQDGYTWTDETGGPVFGSPMVPYIGEHTAALASGGFVQDDGTWVMFFWTFANTTVQGFIGRATAPAPQGPWTVDPEPVLSPGAEGEWDERRVSRPTVVEADGRYLMYYEGINRGLSGSIGLAISDDGVTWTKHDDPATTDAPYTHSDPVFIPELDWMSSHVQQPEVVNTPDGWVMLFKAAITANKPVGMAVSEDGLVWQAVGDGPVFQSAYVPNENSTWQTSLLYHAGKYYLFYEATYNNGSDIYLAIHEGTLGP